jgi:ribosomal protein L37AE/L43A
MKFAKRAEELSNKYSAELKDLKDKAVHVDGPKCWQCGQDMLYDYANDIRRCSNCGASMKRQ